MAGQPKVWNGTLGATAGDADDNKNWDPVSLRNSAYRWLASGSGTNEFYLDLIGGGDPGVVEPANVQEDGTDMVAGTVGSLAAGEWDYGDNDTLGYSTIYVRLTTAPADPDSHDAGYVTFTDTVKASDAVRIPTGAGKMDSNLDQSAVQIASFIMEAGYANDIKTSTGGYAVWNVATGGEVTVHGTGVYKLDFGASDVSITVLGTNPKPGTGSFGLFLIGTNLDTLIVRKGVVGVAVEQGQSCDVDKVLVQFTSNRKADSVVRLGADVDDQAGTGNPDVEMVGGYLETLSDVDNPKIEGGGEYVQLAGSKWAGTAKALNGTIRPDSKPSSGNYGGLVVGGSGLLVNDRDNQAKTINPITLQAGAVFEDPSGDISWTTLTLDSCGIEDLKGLKLGRDMTLDRTML